MADSDLDPKASGSFFRKVVKFVANPSTDWAEISSNTQDEALQGGYAKSELKAMIERKRRNDFVRKREFDLLRKIRREGLPTDGLAGIGASSELEDSEPRSQGVARADDAAVKAKIDEIEQQMEGESNARRAPPQRPPAFYAQPTERGGFDETAPPLNEPFQVEPPPAAANRRAADAAPAAPAAAAPARKPPPGAVPVVNEVDWEATAAYTHKADNTALGGIAGIPLGTGKPPAPANGASATAPAALSPQAGRPTTPAVPRPMRHGGADFDDPFNVEVHEIAHDPELDEAVISFANAEYESCERSITALIAPQGDRANHAETWLVLFDLYRATGQQQPFESLVLDYVQRFGWSAPQWFSIPALVAAEAAKQAAPLRSVHIEGSVGWAAPAQMDADAVAQLDAQTSKMPLPWLIDWRGLASFEVEGCAALAHLMRHWATQKIEMRWVGQDHLLEVLRSVAPNGTRDADPAYWLLRLEVLRLINRPDQFDEVAIDYCVTYEVSPPSWEACKCSVKQADGTGITLASRSVLPEASSSFPESVQEHAGVRTATVELSGQLVGDIGAVLKQLEAKLGDAGVVSINCARLVRMDFIAAGDLLNWVLQRRNEQRLVHFDDAHRLLGLFFNAMGINEHARVKVRNI